jgi:hypothetical protein
MKIGAGITPSDLLRFNASDVPIHDGAGVKNRVFGPGCDYKC